MEYFEKERKMAVWGEDNPMPSQVVMRGYIDHNERIRRSIESGIYLEEWRKGMYDFPNGEIPEQYRMDPTRRPGYDIADASQDLAYYAGRRNRINRDSANVVSTGDTIIKGDASPERAPDAAQEGQKNEKKETTAPQKE